MPKLSDRETTIGIRPTGYLKMSNLELLKKVRGLFRRAKWCQGSNAMTAAGLPCSPMSPDAKCWCARGMTIKALEPNISVLTVDLHTASSKVSMQIAEAWGFDDSRKFVQWNDTQGRIKDEVMMRLDERIAVYELKQLERT